MNIAIVGKAKTGTTATQAAIAESSPEQMHTLFEPKSIDEIVTACENGKYIIPKIIFEHWNTQRDTLGKLLSNEADVELEKIIFIKRDPRDEIVSRLLYVIFPLYENNSVSTDQFRQWKAVLAEKDWNASIPFLQLCADFEDIFGVDVKENVINHATYDTCSYNNFIRNSKIDYCVFSYEDFIDNNMSDLNGYLGFQVKQVMVDPKYDRVRHTSGYGDWKNMMVNSDIEFLREVADGVFSTFGYKSWDTKNPPAKVVSYADYVERIVKSKLR